ncbi:NAD(P)H-dependent oxidoreductase [Fertoebacter nigrum]|uniref:FMN dependent NADH:quinone oxidoreductase n=1 Tax=Fertoeibacter niger TaxID=2656921 RepID=A0A8X8KRA7_9RHOB|nr:NAD(P)H-dependent oxidoreductase [Fertoeibacter niger]NUB44992.1 NAD(P)H-dependent oxidoreductase [Fertoeibacter niger]
MTKLLLIETSPRGKSSISRNMTARLVAGWRDANPHGQIVTRDLASTDLPHATMPWLAAYFTPPHAQTPEMAAQLALSDLLVRELLDADRLVISTPVYNYNIPSSLKAWVDMIVRKGITLGADGQGLLTGKKATVVIASGGVYGPGSPIANRNIAPNYMKLILQVIGITDVEIIHGEGAKAVDLGATTMQAFVDGHADRLTQVVEA